MPRRFNACMGKTLCVENETGCRTCGRTLEEVHTTRRLIDELASFVVDMDYENVNDFLYYVFNKVVKKANHLDDRKRQALSNGYH